MATVMGGAPDDMDESGDPSGSADPSSQDTGSDDFSQGYCIELCVTPDGKMTLNVEPLPEEQQEDGGEDGASGDAEQPQEVANLGEALKMIKQIVAHAGEMQDTGADQDQMSAGYGSDGGS